MRMRLSSVTLLAMCFLLALSSCKDMKRSNYANDEDYDADDLELQDDAATSEAYRELAREVSIANNSCPISLGEVGEITSITFDDGVLEYAYDLEETYANVEALSQNTQLMRQNMRTLVSSPSGAMGQLIDMVIDADARMRFVFHGKSSDATARATLTANELRELREAEVTPLERLQSSIDVTNVQMPMNVEQGLDITELKLIGDNVTYICMVNESVSAVDISTVRANKSAIKQSVKQNIGSMGAVEKQFMQLIIDAEKNLAYRYQSMANGSYVDIVVSNSELKNIINN